MFSVKEKICTFASGSAFILTERKQNYRDVAQLVAYYVRDVGVASSNLVIPTFKGIEKDMKQVHRLVSCLFFVCQVISVQDIKDYQSITSLYCFLLRFFIHTRRTLSHAWCLRCTQDAALSIRGVSCL